LNKEDLITAFRSIGGVPVHVLDILPVVSLYREALQKDPYALYGLVKA